MRFNNIIGDGFLAKNFSKIKTHIKKSNYIIFAAGISNSKTNSKNKLKREIKIFKEFANKYYFKSIVYISTADISDNLKKKNLYVKNKIAIENLIKKKFKKYIILRLPQIIGNSKNKKTLINYFFQSIKRGKKILVFNNVKRNILDVDDVIKVLKIILLNKKIKKKTITLANKHFFQPLDLIKILEKKLNKKANIRLIKNAKQRWKIDNNTSAILFKQAKVSFDKNYLYKKINKYF